MRPLDKSPLHWLLMPALALAAAQAGAADCSVNVLDAYNKAKTQGWQFECAKPTESPHFTAHVVTYPPAAVGCVYKTPSVLTPLDGYLGSVRFFNGPGAPEMRELKGGWYVKAFTFAGAKGDDRRHMYPKNARVGLLILEKPKANRTYNIRLTSMTLSHKTSSCSNVLGKAF